MPTRFPFVRADAAGLAALYAIAWTVRWPILKAAPYADEGTYYMLARTLQASPRGLQHLYGGTWYDGSHLVWLAPLNPFVAMAGAQLGFDAYRLNHLAFTALLPLVAVVLLRAFDVSRPYAYGAGALVVVHQHFVVWSVLTLPDAAMTVAFGLALAAARLDLPRTSASLILASVWLKETALPGAVVILAFLLWDGRRRGVTSLRPLRLTRLQRAWALALAVAPLPFLVFLALGGPVPGGPGHADPALLLDQLVLTAWLWPLVLGGLFLERSRALAAVALLYPLMFLAYRLLLGRAVEIWYATLPAFLAVVAAAAALHAWTERNRNAPSRPRRGAPVLAAAMVSILLAVHVGVPLEDRDPRITMPASGRPVLSLAEVYAYEQGRAADLERVLDFMDAHANASWLFVDVYWSRLVYPVSHHAVHGAYAYSYDVLLSGARERFDRNVTVLARAVEAPDAFTLLEREDYALNRALRETYGDCLAVEADEYSVIAGGSCPGRHEVLGLAYARHARGEP